MDFNSIINGVKAFTTSHAPELLVGTGIAAAGMACILTAKETPKALQIRDALKAKWEREDRERKEPLTVKTKVKRFGEMAWCYIKSYKWAALAFASSVALLVSGTSISLKRTAAASTMATMTREAFYEYKDKVREQIGEDKEHKIQDELDSKHMEEAGAPTTPVIEGKQLCFDDFLKVYFYSTKDDIHKAELEISDRLLAEDFVTLNDYLYMLDMEDRGDLGDQYGWMPDKKPNIKFGCRLTPDNIPALTVHYDIYGSRYNA